MSAGISSVPTGSDRFNADRRTSHQHLQQIGGIAALLQTALYLLTFIFILIIWPMYGVRGPDDASNPRLVLPALSHAPVLSVFSLLDIPIAVCLLLVVLALADRLHGVSPIITRIALTSGLMSVAFFLALGMIRFLGWSQLASLYTQEQTGAATAYAALSALDTAIDGAALFTLAWWALLTHWAALGTSSLPKVLTYVGVLVGVVGIIGGVIPTLRPVALVLVLVWTPSLGLVLLRR